MIQKVRYVCKCGKVHRLTIHWPNGITYLSCGKRIDNKKLLEHEVKYCTECGGELFHDDKNNKSDWCQDCIDADTEYWKDKRKGEYEDF